MLKIIKSKAFKVAGLVIALAFMVTAVSTVSAEMTTSTTTTTTVNASAYNYSGVMKSGSKGPGVATLQAALNSVNSTTIIVDSSFGPATKAAVMQFQAAHGLTVDGSVGPMTGAALSAATVAKITVASTGALCPNGMTLASNCMSAAMMTTTGALCPNGMTLASNCMSSAMTTTTTTTVAGCPPGAMFNSMTAAPCATSTVSTGGPLSINTVTGGSGYNATNVGVGNQNKQVADLRVVTGAGGSGNLTGLNVTFKNTMTGGDYMFTKYASSVSVWENGVQVGSLPASSFTSYNNAFSAYIPLTGAMLNPNTTTDLYIGITALPVIDAANLGSTNNTFSITGVSLRYSDSTGSAFQYSVADSQLTGSTFVFNSAASSNNIKLNVTKDTTDQTDHTTQASASNNTQNVTLATIDLNAQGSNLTIQTLPVTLAVAGGSTVPSDVSNVVSTLRLYNSAGTQVDSETVPVGSTVACPTTGTNANGASVVSSVSGVTGAKCVTVTFTNFNNTNGGINGLALASGSTNIYTVKGDINTLASSSSSYYPGTFAVVELTAANVNSIQAYDANNNRIPSTSGTNFLQGSTTGSKTYFYVNGINVTSSGNNTNTYSAAGGSQAHGIFTMTIPFSVTSYGTTSYIPSATARVTAGTVNAPTATAAANIQYAVDNGATLSTAGDASTGTITYTGSDTLTVDANGNYQIPVGQTKTFNLVVTYNPNAAGSYRAQLVNVNNNTTDSNSTYTVYTSGLNTQAYRTNYVAGQ